MKKQPDFRKLFFDYFGATPKKVRYEIRADSCRYHDLIFFNSLVHDARFSMKSLKKRGLRVTIPIERDCWELYRENVGELPVTFSKLVISPVISIEWRFKHPINFTENDELWILNVWLKRMTFNELCLEIEGDSWNCDLTVLDEDLKIKLFDLEVPHLSKDELSERPK